MKKYMKYAIRALGLIAVATLVLLLTCNQLVVNNAKGKAFSEIDSIKPANYGLLLGTTPQTRIGNRENMFFKYRIQAAVELYEARKIEKILISGDENSLDGVNEPECMRDSLVAHGVPDSVIVLDGKGFRTIYSIINAREIFGLRSFIIISQQFHNERALYQAEHLGLDVEDLQAYNAKSPTSKWAMMTYIREYFARVKMFWDLLKSHKCNNYVSHEMIVDEDFSYDYLRCENSVVGHDERDTIIGNFTGKGTDTLYVVCDTTKADGERWQYYAQSNNKTIPKLNLWGHHLVQPKLVNEGDLDGNGTCDVGYLHTWDNSQWRFYRIFTFMNGEWRYLVYGDYLDTPEWFRCSGKEIAESSGHKGKVLIHYAYEGVNEDQTERIMEIRDTIVVPRFLKQEDDAFDIIDHSFSIDYRQPVNGYKVRVAAQLNPSDFEDVIAADLIFTKNGKSFVLHTQCFGDTAFCKGRLDKEGENSRIFKKYVNQKITADFPFPKDNGNEMPMYSPFFFKDMDFDGIKELVVVEKSMGVRFHNLYLVYRIVEGIPQLINYPPYYTLNNDFYYGMTDYPEFDYKEKTISCPYPEGESRYEGNTIYGVSKEKKDTVDVNGRQYYFNHLEIIKEEKF